MRPLNEFSRTSDIVDAINALVVEEGLRGPSQRRIAAVVRISPGTFMHEYGNRAEMLRRACVQAGRDHARAWRERVEARWSPYTSAARGERPQPSVLLPADARDLSHERQWAAWRELARGDLALRPGLGLALEGERRVVEQVREWMGAALDDDLTDAALALVTGVITRMIDTQDPWPLEHAARVLERGWA